MIEEELGIGIDLQPLKGGSVEQPAGRSVEFATSVTKKFVEFLLPEHYKGTDADVYIDGKILATLNVGAKGKIRVKRQNPIGKALLDALQHGDRIILRV